MTIPAEEDGRVLGPDPEAFPSLRSRVAGALPRLAVATLRTFAPRARVRIGARMSIRRLLVGLIRGVHPDGVDLGAGLTPDPRLRVTSIRVAPPTSVEMILPGFPAPHVWGERRIHRFGPVAVHGPSGLVVVGRHVINASGGRAPDKRKQAEKGLVVDELLALARRGYPGAERFDGALHHTGPVPSFNYYHWLIETLPRILHANRQEPEVRIVLPGAADFMTSALRTLGVDHVISWNHWVASEVLVVDPPEISWPHPADMALLRESVLSRLEGIDGRQRPVYVSRAGSSRSLSGEESLESELEERGFLIFRPDPGRSWTDQPEAFVRAPVVIGSHGAGLSNIVFSPRGTRVIEVVPATYAGQHFRNLAAALGHQYEAIPLACSEGAPYGSAEEALPRVRELLGRGD